jgi:hypothetical protein
MPLGGRKVDCGIGCNGGVWMLSQGICMVCKVVHEVQSSPRMLMASVILLLLTLSLGAAALEPSPPSTMDSSREYFAIQVVDRQTGRGVPLVELRTTNSIRCFTDSNGIVAFREPGLMDREVFFFVESHGYEFPKDGFGYRGARLKTTPGTTAVIKIDRLNIAERVYRVTGQGIYRDSVLTGRSVPLEQPVLNGQVMGQDSVDTCIYHGRLFWLWGDTGKPSYPLGHFATAGAVSDLPGRGGLDPVVGVNLEYYVDEDGFSRPLARLKEPGPVWLDGLLTVKDDQGQERMVAKFARHKDLGTMLEAGLVAFNDATQSFEPVVRADPNVLPYRDFGHAERVMAGGRDYHYFTLPFPTAVRMRVEATWANVIDPNQYEVLTSLQPGLVGTDERARWMRFTDLTGGDNSARARISKALEQEKKDTSLYDIASGKAVSPHGGSTYFNAYRRKWVMIFVQSGGESSFLGEVWYAEADTPAGPWAYARKVVTHNKYSFYNPKQHPYFDQDGGRVIFFEGTYTQSFSGSAETATPCYDYNQIMYRLTLDDPRLVLPVAIYEVRGERGGWDYLLAEDIERAGKWDSVKSVAFYAADSRGTRDGLIPVYARRKATGQQIIRLTTEPPASQLPRIPLFFALPSDEATTNVCVVPLYEYRQGDPQQRIYSIEAQKEGWTREDKPVCRVWRTPPGPLLIDGAVKPVKW